MGHCRGGRGDEGLQERRPDMPVLVGLAHGGGASGGVELGEDALGVGPPEPARSRGSLAPGRRGPDPFVPRALPLRHGRGATVHARERRTRRNHESPGSPTPTPLRTASTPAASPALASPTCHKERPPWPARVGHTQWLAAPRAAVEASSTCPPCTSRHSASASHRLADR